MPQQPSKYQTTIILQGWPLLYLFAKMNQSIDSPGYVPWCSDMLRTPGEACSARCSETQSRSRLAPQRLDLIGGLPIGAETLEQKFRGSGCFRRWARSKSSSSTASVGYWIWGHADILRAWIMLEETLKWNMTTQTNAIQHQPFATPRDGIRRPCSFQGVPPRTSPEMNGLSLSALQQGQFNHAHRPH